MHNVLRTSFSAAALLALTACGRSQVPPTLIAETGCVTASGDRLVLTDLQPAGTTDVEPGRGPALARRPITEAYLLQGADEELRQHVGQQVRVTGEAHPGRVVDIQGLLPMVKATPAGSASGAEETAPSSGTAAPDPGVDVRYQVRLEVSEMDVQSVAPTGERCVEMPAERAAT
jgi:hypothetical protein